jgi:phosphatidylglycerol:prolipoprotein diacylglycerol transferase
LDAAAVFIPLAQSFGRIGNLVNGDILGYPSTLPWATEYTNPNNTFVPSHHVAYQPAAAYELLFSLGLFAIIWALRDRLRTPGTLFTTWLVAYSIGQFFLFFGRANSAVLLGLKQAQLTAIFVVAVAVPLYLWWRAVYLRREKAESTSVITQPSPLETNRAEGF